MANRKRKRRQRANDSQRRAVEQAALAAYRAEL
jgi:hypothetical protein